MVLDRDWSVSVQLIPNRCAKICNSAKFCNKSAKICNKSAKICNKSLKFCIGLDNRNSHQNKIFCSS